MKTGVKKEFCEILRGICSIITIKTPSDMPNNHPDGINLTVEVLEVATTLFSAGTSPENTVPILYLQNEL